MMNDSTLICQDEQRRKAIRKENKERREAERADYLNGLDYLEVGDDPRKLTVYFLDKAPERIEKENLRIEGGRRIRDIRVVDREVYREEENDVDDWMEVVVDRAGDFSTYTLRVVELDERGKPTGEPMADFDPRYAWLDFSFKAGCPSDLDCKPQEVCPPPEYEVPEIDYLAKDYASFRQLILDRLSLIMPDWRERHVPDLGIALVEVLAYAGDHLSYYQDAVATEAYLETARQRLSVRRHARLVDYRLHEGCNARAWVCVETDTDLALARDDVAFIAGYEGDARDKGALMLNDLRDVPRNSYEVFEPLGGESIRLYEAHNEILFYTWGDQECCLPRGATTATLRDEWTETKGRSTGKVSGEQSPEQQPKGEKPHTPDSQDRCRLRLEEGDVLIFEEVLGPRTGNPADADPNPRHPVRLTRVEQDEDKLFGQPVVEIEWAPEDALPFPLCLSAVGLDCDLIENISVARGNVVLVDHGETLEAEDLGTVKGEKILHCEDECHPAETVITPERFRPPLERGPLTFSEPLPANASLFSLTVQDARKALPQVKLTGTYTGPNGSGETSWTARLDLLASQSRDRDFVVEVDNEGRARLRFGDGELGRIPEAGTQFRAKYRVGTGPSGNVGAGTISRVAFHRNPVSGASLRPRNPLPARGGTAPEALAEAKLFAPDAFRSELKRAITADDYARLAERHPAVHRAAATLCWTGSWYEVLVAVDPLGAVVETREDLAAAEAAFVSFVRQTVARYLDLEEFGISRGEGVVGRVIGILRELQAGLKHDGPPEHLLALVNDKLPRMREAHTEAAEGESGHLGSWIGGLVAELERSVGMLPRLLYEIKEYLYPYRRIGHDLAVAWAQYVPLDIALEVCVEPGFLRGHVKAALLDLFSNRVLSDGRRGLFHPDNLSFGDGIYLSRIVAAAQAVPGVESVAVTKLERFGEGQNHEIENGILPLGPLEVARLDNDPSFPENGVLTLKMAGGR
jgi:hypothetical protein